MELLLDTHTFIWFINGDKSLPAKTKKIIANLDNKCFISIASVWEIAIKLSIKRLKLKSGFDRIAGFIADNDIEILPISFNHLQILMELEFYHRDPFDRIIIAQSMAEQLTVLTKDENFKHYPVKIMWN